MNETTIDLDQTDEDISPTESLTRRWMLPRAPHGSELRPASVYFLSVLPEWLLEAALASKSRTNAAVGRSLFCSAEVRKWPIATVRSVLHHVGCRGQSGLAVDIAEVTRLTQQRH